jgi:predicted RNase H-like HicB family nuclease
MTHYIAIIHKEADSDFGVSFPDFAGCITAGSIMEEARLMAKEALALHIQGMQEDGDSIPAPSSLDEVQAARHEGDMFMMVEYAPQQDEAVKRVNITLTHSLLQQIDAYTQQKGLTRSGFLAYAAKALIDKHTPQ